MKRRLAMLAALVLSATTGSVAAADCGYLALVSGYRSNNVHVFDACDGRFIRVLDDAGRIKGPQAVRLGGNGLIYVVSEENGRIIRYQSGTLAFKDVFIETGPDFNPTGVDLAANGDVFVGGYKADSVRRYDGGDGHLIDTPVPPQAAGLDGPDNGLVFGPDGRLYVPSYDNGAVVVWDPKTGKTTSFVAPGAGGLKTTRGIYFEGGGTVLISSENTGQLLRFTAEGKFLEVFAEMKGRPAGFSRARDGGYLAGANADDALRISADGRTVTPFLGDKDRGGLVGSTYVAVIPSAKVSGLDPIGAKRK